MLIQQEKECSKGSGDLQDTLVIGVYTVYDTVLKQFDSPISIPLNKLDDYMKLIVNDVSSRYYGHESDFVLNKIGVFNQDTGEIECHFVERISFLDSYIDKYKRNLQTIVRTLNFLPQGYFKMPIEQKQSIQEKIDCSITEYVANYVIPDLDVSQYDTKKINDIYKRYNDFTRILDTRNDFVSGTGLCTPYKNDET